MDSNEKKQELRAHYERVRSELLAAIDGLDAAAMTAPSIDGWSVKDHMAHLSVWDEIRRSEIQRISEGGNSMWPMMTDEQVETLNTLVADLRRGLSLEQVRDEFDASRRRVLDAIAAASDTGLEDSRYGEAGLRSTHDLAHADMIRRWRARTGR